MPSERELKRHLRAVRSIQQVTKAMQTVAASRMRRAQQATLASRPFEERLRAVLNDLAPYADPEVNPLLARRPVRNVTLILITSDRGLVGAMNTNMIRAGLRFGQEQPSATFIPVGRKAVTAMRRLRRPMVAEFIGMGDRPTTAQTGPISTVATEEFLAERADEVHIGFTRFVSTLRQVPTIRRLLPLAPEELDIKELPPLQYLFEPDAETVLGVVLPRLIELAVYQAVLENVASEQSARMVAMRNATDNAGELIDVLQLEANKARQSRITREMLEIASGAQALAGA